MLKVASLWLRRHCGSESPFTRSCGTSTHPLSITAYDVLPHCPLAFDCPDWTAEIWWRWDTEGQRQLLPDHSPRALLERRIWSSRGHRRSHHCERTSRVGRAKGNRILWFLRIGSSPKETELEFWSNCEDAISWLEPSLCVHKNKCSYLPAAKILSDGMY